MSRRPAIRNRGAGGRGALAPLVLLLAFASTARPSTLVAPHALYLSDASRSAVLYLQNTGDGTQEVSIDLQFGYPVSDSTGTVHVELVPEPDPSEPSAAGWVRALPRRAFLQPGERRAVRFLAEPRADLPDGEYWTRVIVASQPSQVEAPAVVAEGVSAQLILRSRMIVPLSYRRGDVATGVHLVDFEPEVRDSTVVAHVRMERLGNAAYLAKLELALVDPETGPRVSWVRDIAVYRDLYRRIELPVTMLPKGIYVLTLRLSTERDDIPARHVLAFAPVEVETPVLLE